MDDCTDPRWARLFMGRAGIERAERQVNAPSSDQDEQQQSRPIPSSHPRCVAQPLLQSRPGALPNEDKTREIQIYCCSARVTAARGVCSDTDVAASDPMVRRRSRESGRSRSLSMGWPACCLGFLLKLLAFLHAFTAVSAPLYAAWMLSR